MASLPTTAGVYLFKDDRGSVLYVGKAVNLRSRVRTYFQTSGGDGRRLLPFLRAKTRDVDTISVTTEKEALLLENNLIKQHKPRYNVRLVDDKTYLSLRLDRRHAFPRFTTVRQRRDAKSRYFGPYSSARSVRSSLKLIYRNFGIRSCTDSVLASRARPCLYYQIGQCLAPCVDYVTKEDYAHALGQAEMFLDGRDAELADALRSEMQTLADEERFEEAARVRDKLASVSRTLEKQTVSFTSDGHFDVIAHSSASQGYTFVWLMVRDGRLVDTSTSHVRVRGDEDLAAVYTAVIAQAYGSRPVPTELVVPVRPADDELLEQILTDRRGAVVKIHIAFRGRKRQLLELAGNNAAAAAEVESGTAKATTEVLESLQSILGLTGYPARIECCDISNLGGTLTVGSIVVAVDGSADRSLYRHYRLRTAGGGDDYAAMHEVIHRRLTRAIREQTVPDLLLLDGGPGQLAVAQAVAVELGLADLPLAAISKGPDRNAGREQIHLPHQDEPLRLVMNDPRLHLLQRIRDEAHRFAITYNRKLRKKRDRANELLEVPGIGPKRSRHLLRTFGSLRALKTATAADLEEKSGMTQGLARRLYDHLHPNTGVAMVAEATDQRVTTARKRKRVDSRNGD